MYKKFDKKLYDENNKRAVDECKNLFNQFGYNILKSKEAYKDWDFLVEKNDNIISVEVEVKKVWTKQGRWQGYSTVDIPFRKSASKADMYIMFNALLNTLIFCKMRVILKAPKSNKDTIYTHEEPFFNVEVDKFFLMEKEGNDWKHLTENKRIPFLYK
jgi:hypothetical protein